MYDKLKSYVSKFNSDDEEFYKHDIDNLNAERWMRENIPLIAIPDKTVEEIYYFRWWVFRKHVVIKNKMNKILFDGSFYKAIHIDDLAHPSIEKIPESQNVKELIGYIPWCFNLAE